MAEEIKKGEEKKGEGEELTAAEVKKEMDDIGAKARIEQKELQKKMDELEGKIAGKEDKETEDPSVDEKLSATDATVKELRLENARMRALTKFKLGESDEKFLTADTPEKIMEQASDLAERFKKKEETDEEKAEREKEEGKKGEKKEEIKKPDMPEYTTKTGTPAEMIKEARENMQESVSALGGKMPWEV